MTKISEKELKNMAKDSAINALKIYRRDDGYAIVINPRWSPGDYVLYGQRGELRTWVSLDRLIRYLEKNKIVSPVNNLAHLFFENGR